MPLQIENRLLWKQTRGERPDDQRDSESEAAALGLHERMEQLETKLTQLQIENRLLRGERPGDIDDLA